MFNADSHDRKRRSLLSLGRTQSAEHADELAGEGVLDAATRHRLARSRREAAPSPLISALSRDQQHKLSPRSETVERSPGSAEGGASPDSSWSLSRLLPGRRRSTRESEAKQSDRPGPERQRYDASRRTIEESAPASRQASSDPDLYWRPLIDPLQVVRGIGNAKKTILATTIAGALLGAAIAVATPKKYESVAELLVDPRDLKIVDRDLTQSGLPSDATMAIVENQVRVLTSGTVLNKVVDRLNLSADPEFNGQGSRLIVNPIAILRSLLTSGPGGQGDNRHALAVTNLAQSLEVERGGKTFVVVITARTESPEKSALIANTLTDVFLQTYGEIQADTAGRATDELTSRLADMRAEVEAAERKVEEYKSQNDIIDAGGKLISDEEMVKLNEQLTTARARSIELNAKAQSARDLDVDAVLNGTLPEQINSNVMTELRSQYASIKQEADRLSVRLGPRHPQFLAVEAQLAGAREQIRNELRRIVAANQVELKRAVKLEQDLAARLAQVKVRQGGVSEDLVALRQLEREAAAKRAVYESFLLRSRETSEQRDLNTANMSVISKAYPPLEPVGPSRSTITLAGALLGMLAGIGIGGVRGALRSLNDGANPQPSDRGGPSGPTSPGGRPVRERDEIEPEPGLSEPKRRAREDAAPRSFVGGADEGPERARPARRTFAVTRRERPAAERPMKVSTSVAAERNSAAAPSVRQDWHAPATETPSTPAPARPAPPVPMPAQTNTLPLAYSPQMQPAYVPVPVLQPPMAYAYPPPPMAHPWPLPMAHSHIPAMPPYPGWAQFASPPAQEPREAAATRADIEEVRESLRAFREAVLDRPELRARRRYR